MEENLNYGIPAQDAGYTNQTMENTFVGNEVNTFATNSEPVMQEAYVQEAVMQEPVVQEAQVTAPTEAVAQPQPKQLQIPEIPEGSVRIIVETNILKEALKKADIVALKNELSPITEVVMFRVIGKTVQVRASDRENILTVNMDAVDATDGIVVTLKIAQLKPLIDRIKDDVTVMLVNGTTVTVVTKNGEYNFSQALDLTTNEIITVPDVDAGSIPFEETAEITKEAFLKSVELVLPLVGDVANDTQYSAINIGNKVTSTTGDEVGVFYENVSGVLGTSALVKVVTIKDLIAMGVSDKLNIGFGTLGQYKTMCIYTNGYRLYSVLKEGEEEYPVDEIDNLLGAVVGDYIQINKSQLLDAIDRLSLFFASNLARQNLKFEKAGNVLEISNEGKAKERLIVGGNGNVTIALDRKRLTTVTKSMPTEDILIEPLVNGDGPISYIKVSSTDRKVVFVIAAAL